MAVESTKEKRWCTQGEHMKPVADFYKSNNIEKYPPDGRLDVCKTCLTRHVDCWDPSTFLPILEMVDIPYVEDQWNGLLQKYIDEKRKFTGSTLIGRYIGMMKLSQFKNDRWADTERLRQAAEKEKTKKLREKGYTEAEIQEELKKKNTPARVDTTAIAASANAAQPGFEPAPEEVHDAVSAQLTNEERTMLTLKWGRGYTWEEKVRMEQLYTDMMNSYDIQTAGHKDNLIMLCKTSLKANQLLDAGD